MISVALAINDTRCMLASLLGHIFLILDRSLYQVSEDEGTVLIETGRLNENRRRKARKIPDECVKLPIFSTGIDAVRKSVHDRQLELNSSPLSGDALRVDTCNGCLQSSAEHFKNQAIRGSCPERKNRFQPCPVHPLFAICSDIFEMQVAESDARDTFLSRLQT